jgi:hypothetical protein
MTSEQLNFTLAVIQGIQLLTLVVYSVFTWVIAAETRHSAAVAQDALRELRETRLEESAPYVVGYFDVPYGRNEIELVVKNVGKTVAHDIRLEFDPPFRGLTQSHQNTWPRLFTDGIASLPPGYEIRTWINSYAGYYSANAPMTYELFVRYRGNNALSTQHTVRQTLDLWAYFNRCYTPDVGLPELVKEVKEFGRHSQNISRSVDAIKGTLTDGLWFKNPDALSGWVFTDNRIWRQAAQSKLTELQILWEVVYPTFRDELAGGAVLDFENRTINLAAQLWSVAAAAPRSVGRRGAASLVRVAIAASGPPTRRVFSMGRTEEYDEVATVVLAAVHEAATSLARRPSPRRSHGGRSTQHPPVG